MLEILKILTDINSLKALTQPFYPALSRVVLIVFGMFLGIFAVYASLPLLGVQFTSADPVHLTDGYKDTWVKNAALAYEEKVYANPEVVLKSDLERAGYGPSELEALANENQDSPRIAAALLAARDIPAQDAANDYQGKVSTNILSNIGPFICLFGFLIIFSLLGIILSFKPVPIGPWRKGAIVGHESTRSMGEKERERRRALDEAREQAAEGFDEPLGEPVASFMSAYVLGDDLYDDSFAIEPDGGFAGECGIGIAETIGEGNPKKITAFEVWVFDQAEIQTLTYVLMSEHAYNDPALRAKLAPRGEAVMVSAGKVLTLETRMLKMQVRIIDAKYGEGSLPDNSFFDKITFALAVWQKEGAITPGVKSDDLGLPTPVGSFAPPPSPASFSPQAPQQPSSFTPQPPVQQQQPPIQQQSAPSVPLQPPPLQPQGARPPLPHPSQQSAPPVPLQPPPIPPQSGQSPLPPPQMGQPPQPSGGIRPLTGNVPGGPPPLPPQGVPPQQSGLPPQQPQQPFGSAGRMPPTAPPPDQPTVPGRRPPDDPFGDTNEF